MVMLLKAFGFILLFFVLAAGGLLALMTVAEWHFGDLSRRPDVTLWLILAALVIVIGGFVPYLNFAMRRSFVLRPSPGTEPVSEDRLREDLLAINGLAVPVSVTPRRRGLVIGWRYADGIVRGLLAEQRLKKIYELEVKLDGSRGEAILTDVRRQVRWRRGPDSLNFGWSFARGYFVGMDAGIAHNLRYDLTTDRAYRFRFRPEEIKEPVIRQILAAGWTVRCAIW